VRVTTKHLQQMKSQSRRISMITCYDATFAKILDRNTSVDILFIGDSLGMVIKGDDNTLGVSVEEIAYHTRAVAKGSQRAHVLADLPFLSYHLSDEDTLRNAGTLLRAGAHSVKLEGGVNVQNRVRLLVDVGIPVMGHIGLTPQSVHALGGHLVQGKTPEAKERLLADALALEAAGAYAVVIESVPEDIAQTITSKLTIPTIGIGAGKHCDGQVLVLHDLLDLNPEFRPKFVKHYAPGASLIAEACQNFVAEVQDGSFPGPEHTFYGVKKTDP
jgi:3-methyl-2-oxobutanoate hydroxymethyltransferase